jgi:alpha-glucosidase
MNEPASFCRFPCDDPDQQAEERGLPPAPPPSRKPPRSIPGLPSTRGNVVSLGSLGSYWSQQRPLRRSIVEDDVQDIPPVSVDHEGDDLLFPPYKIDNAVPSGELSDQTVYTNLKHANGQWTYDVHNLYGMRECSLAHSVMRHTDDGNQSWAWRRARQCSADDRTSGRSS